MSAPTLETVKTLRDRTGAGMMDCKEALQASGNDVEKAIDLLRKKGIASAAKRAGREAREGLIVLRVEGPQAAMTEVNCETDFVAKTEDFKALAALAVSETLVSGDAAAASPKIEQRVAELTGKIGEKILVRRTKLVRASGGALFSYLHANQKIGVVVELTLSETAKAQDAALQELGKNLAMQVAAANPLCVSRQEVPAAVIEREKAIYREEVKGKPDNIVEKIVQGKLEKFYQTSCLLEQPFIKDDKIQVRRLIEDVAKKVSVTLTVKQFVRYQLGESVPS